MFEQGLSFVLKKLLRDFVEDGDNLNDKVQVGVWSGLIVLENLVLKNSIFNLLELPIVLNYGYIGRFELHIPWSRLGSEPVTVVLDKIHILVEPKYEWNPGAADRREQAMKQAKLAAAELFASQRLHQQQQTSSSGGVAGLAKNWFMGALLSKIIDKFQVTIRELHFRYEDRMSCPTEFCVGFSFESLHLLSREGSGGVEEGKRSMSLGDTSRNYDKELKISGADAWYKLVELNHLAFYWNPLHSKGLDVCSCAFIGRAPREIQTLMSRTIVTRVFKSYERPRHHYILSPVDIKAYLDVSVNISTGAAKAKVKVFISDIGISLEDKQLREIISMGTNMANFSKLEKFSEYRPVGGVMEDPRAWWKYAIHAVLVELRLEKKKQFSLTRLMKRAHDKLVYVELWKARLISPSNMVSQLGQTAPSLPFLDRESSAVYIALLAVGKKRKNLEQKLQQRRGSAKDSASASRYPSVQEDDDDMASVLPLDNDKALLLQQLEYDLSFEDILFFRSMAELHAPPDTINDSWIGSVIGWVTGKGSGSNDEERGKLIEALKYDPDHLFRGGQGKVDYNEVMSIVDIFLEQGSVTLALSPPADTSTTSFQPAIPFLQLKLEELRVKTVSMGDGSRMRVYCSLQELEGYELLQPPAMSTAPRGQQSVHYGATTSFPSATNGISGGGSSYPAPGGPKRAGSVGSEMIQHRFIFRRTLKLERTGTVGSESNFSLSEDRSTTNVSASGHRLRASSTAPLFSSVIEVAPPGSEVEVSVKLDLEELEMWFSPSARWIDSVIIFSTWPEEMAYWSEMEMKAMNQFKDIKSRVNAKLEYMMHNHANIVIEGNIQAPILVVHDYQSSAASYTKTNLLVVDLGLMSLHTQKLAKAQRTKVLEAQSHMQQTMFHATQLLESTPLPGSPSKGGEGKGWEVLHSEHLAQRDQVKHDAAKDSYPQDLDLLCFEGVPTEEARSTGDQPIEDDTTAGHRRSSIFHKYGEHPLQTPHHVNLDFDSDEEELFDIFDCKISHIEVYFIEGYVTTASDGRWSVQYESNSKTVMVERFEINIEIQVSALPWDITLPPVKLFVDIPEINVELSDAKITRIMSFVAQMLKQSQAIMSANADKGQKKKIKEVTKTASKAAPPKALRSSLGSNKSLLAKSVPVGPVQPSLLPPNLPVRSSKKRRKPRTRSLGDSSTVFSDAKSVMSGSSYNPAAASQVLRDGDASAFFDPQAPPEEDDDSDDDSFFSVEDEHEEDAVESHLNKSLEELKFTIQQRERMHTKILSDLRFAELDTKNTVQLENLRKELTVAEMELHQLKVSYVELLMKNPNYLEMLEDTDGDYNGYRNTQAFEEHVENMLSPHLLVQNKVTANAQSTRKRDMIQASVFKLSGLSGSEAKDLSKGPNKELFYMRVNIVQINIDLLGGVDAASQLSSSYLRPSRRYAAFHSRFGLTNFGLKLRHRSHDTKISSHLRDVLFSEQAAHPKFGTEAQRANVGVPLITSDPSYASATGAAFHNNQAYELLRIKYEIQYGGGSEGQEFASKHLLKVNVGYLALNFDQQRILPLVLWGQDIGKVVQSALGLSDAAPTTFATVPTSAIPTNEHVSAFVMPCISAFVKVDCVSLSWINGPQGIVNATLSAAKVQLDSDESLATLSSSVVDFTVFDLTNDASAVVLTSTKYANHRLGSSRMVFGRNVSTEAPLLQCALRGLRRADVREDGADVSEQWVVKGSVKVAPVVVDVQAAFVAAVCKEIMHGPLLATVSALAGAPAVPPTTGPAPPSSPLSLETLRKDVLADSLGSVQFQSGGVAVIFRVDDEDLLNEFCFSAGSVRAGLMWGYADAGADVQLTAKVSEIMVLISEEEVIDPLEVSAFAFVSAGSGKLHAPISRVLAAHTLYAPDALPAITPEEIQAYLSVSPVVVHYNRGVHRAIGSFALSAANWGQCIASIVQPNEAPAVNPLHTLRVKAISDESEAIPPLWVKISCSVKVFEAALLLEEVVEVREFLHVAVQPAVARDVKLRAGIQNIIFSIVLHSVDSAGMDGQAREAAEATFRLTRLSVVETGSSTTSQTLLQSGSDDFVWEGTPMDRTSRVYDLGNSFVSGRLVAISDGQYRAKLDVCAIQMTVLASSILATVRTVESIIRPDDPWEQAHGRRAQSCGAQAPRPQTAGERYAFPSSVPMAPSARDHSTVHRTADTERPMPLTVVSYDALWMDMVKTVSMEAQLHGVEIFVPLSGDPKTAALCVKTRLQASMLLTRPLPGQVMDVLLGNSSEDIVMLALNIQVPVAHVCFTDNLPSSTSAPTSSSELSKRAEGLSPPRPARRQHSGDRYAENSKDRVLMKVDCNVAVSTVLHCRPGGDEIAAPQNAESFWQASIAGSNLVVHTKAEVEMQQCEVYVHMDYRPFLMLNSFLVCPLLAATPAGTSATAAAAAAASVEANNEAQADTDEKKRRGSLSSKKKKSVVVVQSLPDLMVNAINFSDMALQVAIHEVSIVVVNDILPHPLSILQVTVLETTLRGSVPYPTRSMYWLLLGSDKPRRNSVSELLLGEERCGSSSHEVATLAKISSRSALDMVKSIFGSRDAAKIEPSRGAAKYPPRSERFCTIDIEFSSAITVEYFNQKLLAVEPLVEPMEIRGSIRLLRTSKDSHEAFLVCFNTNSAHSYEEVAQGVMQRTYSSFLRPPDLPGSSTKADIVFPPEVSIHVGKINVNVTIGLLEMAFLAAKSMETLLGSDGKGQWFHHRSGSHLVVRNDSGMPIKYWSSRSAPAVLASSCEESLVIDDEDDGSTQLRHLAALNKSPVRSINLALQRADGTFGSAHNDITLEGVGFRILSIDDSSDKKDGPGKKKAPNGKALAPMPSLVLEVASRNGSKMLVVRSTMRVYNSSNTAFYIRLVDGQTCRWECYLPPSRGSFVPAELCGLAHGQFQISPRPIRDGSKEVEKLGSAAFPCPDIPGFVSSQSSASDESKESAAVMFRRKVAEENHVSTVTYSHWIRFLQPQKTKSVSRDQTLYEKLSLLMQNVSTTIAVEAKGTPLKKQTNPDTCMIRNIKVMAPLQLVNLLGNSIELAVVPDLEAHGFYGDLEELHGFDRAIESLVPSYALRPGEATECLMIHPRESFFIAIKYFNEHLSVKPGWTRFLRIPAAPEEAPSQPITLHLDLHFKNESSLTLHVEIVDKGGCRVLNIFTPYWIISNSFLPLQFQHEGGGGAQRVNGSDGLAADQLFETEAKVKVKRDEILPRGIGRARGMNGIILGPEAPIKGLSDILYPSSHRAAVLSALKPATSNVTSSRMITDGREGRGGRLLAGGHDTLTPAPPGAQSPLGNQTASAPVFSLVHANYTSEEKGKIGRIRFRHKSTAWSDYIHVDSSLSTTTMSVTTDQSSHEDDSTGLHSVNSPFFQPGLKQYTFGVYTYTLDAPFHRSQGIIITDQYVLYNEVGETIEVKQFEQAHICTVQPNGSPLPLWFRAPMRGKVHIQVRLSRYGWGWSGQIALDSEGEYPVRLKNEYDHTVYFMYIYIRKTGPRVSIVCKGHDHIYTYIPYRFENHTVETFLIQQEGQDQCVNLLPYHTCMYAWDEPFACCHKFKLAVLKNMYVQTEGYAELGTYSFDKLEMVQESKAKHLVCKVVARGPTRVFQIFDHRLGNQMYSPLHSSQLQRSIINTKMVLKVDVDSLGVSIVDQSPEELLYLALEGIKLRHTVFVQEAATSVTLHRLQLDNQLWSTPYPSILHPLPASSQAAQKLDFVSLDMVQSYEYNNDVVLMVPEFSLSVQPFDVNLECTIIYKLVHMAFKCINLLDEVTMTLPQFGSIHTESVYDYTDMLATSVYALGNVNGEGFNPRVLQRMHDLTHQHYGAKAYQHSASTHSSVYSPLPKGSSTVASSAAAACSPASHQDAPVTHRNTFSLFIVRNHLDKLQPVMDRLTPGLKVYFQKFKVSELTFNLSFNPIVNFTQHDLLTPYMDIYLGNGLYMLIYVLTKVLVAIGSIVVKVDNCPLKFSPETHEHIFLSTGAFASALLKSYTIQMLKQSYMLLLSTQVLGNPVHIYKMLSQGVYDFVNFPREGLTGPGDFALGMLRGSSSLVRNVVCSVCTTMDHVCVSMQTGLIALGVVDSYHEVAAVGEPAGGSSGGGSSSVATAEQQTAIVPVSKGKDNAPTRPTNSFHAMYMAATGLVRDPVMGFKQDGLRGFLVGGVKGVLGLLARPIYGVLGDSSVALQKVSFTLLPRYLATQKLRLSRARPPRYFLSPHLPIHTYSYNENRGIYLLNHIRGGIYRQEDYMHHAKLTDETSLLMTRARVLVVEEVLDSLHIQWQCPIQLVLSLEVVYVEDVHEVKGLAEANAKALLRMIASEDREGGGGVAEARRGDSIFPQFHSRLRGRPVLVCYHLPPPDRSARSATPPSASSEQLLEQHRVTFPSHEELLLALHKLLRVSPSLASADIHSYIQACGVDVAMAMRMAGNVSRPVSVDAAAAPNLFSPLSSALQAQMGEGSTRSRSLSFSVEEIAVEEIA